MAAAAVSTSTEKATCRFFLRGECKSKSGECKYSHDVASDVVAGSGRGRGGRGRGRGGAGRGNIVKVVHVHHHHPSAAAAGGGVGAVKPLEHIPCQECHASGTISDKYGIPCDDCGGKGYTLGYISN